MKRIFFILLAFVAISSLAGINNHIFTIEGFSNGSYVYVDGKKKCQGDTIKGNQKIDMTEVRTMLVIDESSKDKRCLVVEKKKLQLCKYPTISSYMTCNSRATNKGGTGSAVDDLKDYIGDTLLWEDNLEIKTGFPKNKNRVFVLEIQYSDSTVVDKEIRTYKNQGITLLFFKEDIWGDSDVKSIDCKLKYYDSSFPIEERQYMYITDVFTLTPISIND